MYTYYEWYIQFKNKAKIYITYIILVPRGIEAGGVTRCWGESTDCMGFPPCAVVLNFMISTILWYYMFSIIAYGKTTDCPKSSGENVSFFFFSQVNESSTDEQHPFHAVLAMSPNACHMQHAAYQSTDVWQV